MYSFIKKLAEKNYLFWLNLLNIKAKTKILPVNFNKKWTTIIFSQKKLLVYSIITQISTQVFFTIVPLLIGQILEQRNYKLFYILMASWVGALIVEYISYYFMAILEVQCINSIQYRAFEFFLTVDPISHTQRESGKLFAKIERASRAYEDFLDILLWDLTPIFIGLSTIIGTFLWIDIKLGIFSFSVLILIALLSITLTSINTLSFEKTIIKADDQVKTINVESLTQVQLIRSYFASDEIAGSSKNAIKGLMYKEGTGWLAFGGAMSITRLSYLVSILLIGTYIINLINMNTISVTTAITILLTYLRGTGEIIKIGRRIKKIFSAITKITDLFNFIQNFGKQTFPVLAINHEVTQSVKLAQIQNHIDLEIEDLYFDYPKAQIFENHSLNLKIPRNDENKLYGIIGPSGMGKTTLISILGGQLKPIQGTITLNGVSIYNIDDHARKKLIALQGQIASSLSGTLRKNLLLGLPPEDTYSDEEMIKILKEVGIWKVFDEKNGLDTQIGEGGLTISGGQRQRLNFASLYLRATYFKPLLILIDEPTSSLDDVSEQAITKMICKLAKNALTFVIAHRLKTIKDAVKIIDFSLIDQEKKITLYAKEELILKSTYYKKLIEGYVDIEI